MKYKIVKAWSHDHLEDRVDFMLHKGWQLQGGVSVTVIKHVIQYAQAMIKHDEVKVNVEDDISRDLLSLMTIASKYR